MTWRSSLTGPLGVHGSRTSSSHWSRCWPSWCQRAFRSSLRFVFSKIISNFFFKIFSPEWVDYQPYQVLAKLPCEVTFSLIKSEKFDFIKAVWLSHNRHQLVSKSWIELKVSEKLQRWCTTTKLWVLQGGTVSKASALSLSGRHHDDYGAGDKQWWLWNNGKNFIIRNLENLGCGPSGLLDNVLHAIWALRPMG